MSPRGPLSGSQRSALVVLASRSCVFLLSVTLATCALAKLFGGHRDDYAVPSWIFWALTAAEAAMAVLVWPRATRHLALCSAMVLATGGVVHALGAKPSHCGCIGDLVHLDWFGELVLAWIVGVLGAGAFLTSAAGAGAARD